MARRASVLVGAAVAVVVLASTLPVAAQDNQSQDVELTVGEQKAVSATGVQSYSEGVQGIVDVRLTHDGTKFILVALRPGETTLLLIMQDGHQVQYHITVSSQHEAPSGVQPTDNIRLDFYFVQLSESYGHQLGISWPASIGGPQIGTLTVATDLLTPAVLSATALITNQPLPRIDILQATGWARLTSQVALITANGNEASYQTGGEVNVPVAGSISAEIRQITFGSTVKVLPRYDRNTGRIELRIRADVSNLTADRGTGVPGRDVSHVDTVVNLEMGQSVALAGLISDNVTETQSGLPGLSQIPILGILFGSNARKHESSQNVVFIVPTVVDAVSLQARQRITEAYKVYQNYTGGLDEVQLMPVPHGVPSAARPGASGSTDGGTQRSASPAHGH